MKKGIEEILNKTRQFIRAYYRNKMLKGFFIAFSLLLILFLITDLVEYFSWMSSTVRTVVFYGFIATTFSVIVYYILVPALKMFNIGKTMTLEEAARIIGEHIGKVNDKLLNSIELLEELKSGNVDSDLITAGIEQKANELSPIPFIKAVDKKSSYLWAKRFFPLLLIFLLIFLLSPSLITEPSKRIVKHNIEFQQPLPFRFQLISDSLVILQNEDFPVVVRFIGDEIPEKVYLTVDDKKYLMQNDAAGQFIYTLHTVPEDIYFGIKAGAFKSRNFHLKVFPKPVILNYEIDMDYPYYLGKKNEKLENVSDLTLPEGTKVNFIIYTRDIDSLFFTDGLNKEFFTKENNVFSREMNFVENDQGIITGFNRFTSAADSIPLNINIIKDEYPKISVQRKEKESFFGNIIFDGEISDDYGFHSLKFHYKKENSEKWRQFKLKITPYASALSFRYSVNPKEFGLQSGEKLEYYFSVSDNDEIHHYKTTKTPVGFIIMPDNADINRAIDSTSARIKNNLDESLRKLKEIQKRIEENKLNMLNKEELNWMDKERLKNILTEQIELQQRLEELSEKNMELNKLEELKKEKLENELAQQMNELKKLFEALKNPQLIEQLEKAKKELEKMDKDKLQKVLEKIEKNNESLEKNLEQNDELYKTLEFEKRFKEALSQLDSLQQKEKTESLKNENKLQSKERAMQKQDSLNKSFEKSLQKLKTALELNKKLEDPLRIGLDKKMADDINKEMNEALEKLENKRQKKASGNQKNASEKMEEMKNALQAAFENEMSARMGEDAENMKRLLDNLVILSFDQEDNIKAVKNTSKNDPQFVENIDRLQQIRENFKIIDDSLQAIAKRNVFVKPFILKESNSVKYSLERAASALQDRNTGNALTQQQYAMTSMNNLALLMEESLEKMQQSMMNMKNSGKGSQSCPNPGNGKGQSLSEMISKQKQLSKSLNKMKGKQKGKSGGKKGGGENGSSEELARMAAIQAQIRRMLQEYMEQLKAEGGTGNAMNDLLKEMLQNEKDIVNKNITEQTLKRQHDIEVRLLKAENARLEREKKKERESEEGKNINRSNLIREIKYNRQLRKNKDVIITNKVKLNPFYRNLYNKYINKLEKENGSNR